MLNIGYIDPKARNGDGNSVPITASRGDVPAMSTVYWLAVRRGKNDEPHGGLGEKAIDEPGEWDGV